MFSIALKKSEFVLFSNSHKSQLFLDVGGHKIGLKDNVIYLGIRLNRKLNRTNHTGLLIGPFYLGIR